MITTNNLSREFIRYKHAAGLKGIIKSLLCRKKEIVNAVRNVSFPINKGEFVGYIGPNGAGKSSTIKMLTGILTPTSGSVIVNGINPVENRAQNAKNIGAIFGQRSQLWWDLPIADSYTLFKSMYKIDAKLYVKRVDAIKELLGLGGALLHNPRVLYLDEPTIGMDILVKERIKVFLKNINQQNNVTIILTTHDLQEIEALCSRVILINHGALLY